MSEKSLYSGTYEGTQTQIVCCVSNRTGGVTICTKFRKSHHWNGGISTNPHCPAFLGCVVAEQALSKVFKNVKRMPTNNPGYDFICGREYKIDVKSSCFMKYRPNQWRFKIRQNTIADYFLCLAFDNRTDLRPLHLWLIPGTVVNQTEHAAISKIALDKWAEYELNIDKVVTCCDAMRQRKRTLAAMQSAKQITEVI